MIAFLYYTEWYFIFPLYFKNYFQKMAAISYRQRDWFHGTIKENKGNTDSIVVRLGSCIFMQGEE